MGHHHNLTMQITQAYQDMLAIGTSKHQAKKDGSASEKIFSWETYHSYKKHAGYFAEYCKAEHGCKTLAQCERYASEWLRMRVESGLSPYTLKLEASALAKLYGCRSEDFGVEIPRCRRADITRSRGEAVRDKHFSEKRNADLVSFCRSTGLRRSELENIKGTALRTAPDGSAVLHVQGKGGKWRDVPVIGDVSLVVRMCQSSGTEKVFQKVSSNADIHGYRAEYATRLYNCHARDLETCKADGSVYWCRGDRKGTWFDRKAMLIASRALGHNRVSVIGAHYIR